MMIKKSLLLTITVLSNCLAFAQPFTINKKERAYCDSVKEIIFDKDWKLLKTQFSNNIIDDFDSIKGKFIKLIKEVESNDWGVNKPVGRVKHDGITRFQYSFRWSDVNYDSMFILRFELKESNNKYLIDRVVFVSYLDNITTESFPPGEIEVPPRIAPPPPPGFSNKR